MLLATEKELVGIIAFSDTLRCESGQAIRELHREGVNRVIMLTGDSNGTAKAIAEKAGIDEYYAQVLPEDKLRRVEELKQRYGSVAMAGDGINDAPALAASTVGIAMGTSGTDIALETADVVLMSDDLLKLPWLMRLSKRTLSIIKQNIAIALATKLLFMTLGLLGVATLWMAVLADDGAALIVILNGLRVMRSEKW